MPPLYPSCLQATFAAWSVQVRSQMCPHTSWQRISNRPHFLLPFSAFIIRSSMAGKSKLACKFLKTFQHHSFLDHLNIMGIIIYLSNMKVEKKKQNTKMVDICCNKNRYKSYRMLECPIFSDFRFKGMQAFSYQYIKFSFLELLYRGLDMERFYRVKN